MFERFLRPGKHKMPDIDMDFESERRQEVIDYIHNRYKGRTAQITTYGLYKADNLINDLFRVREDLPKEYMDIMKKKSESYIQVLLQWVALILSLNHY